MRMPHRITGIVWVYLAVLASGFAHSQDYPSKTIRIITASVASGSDFMSRQIAQGISGPLGQPVIVENRGTGVIVGDFLSKAPPDGYGLVVTGNNFWIGPLFQKVPYDVARDFSPISYLSRDILILVVHPSLPVKSVKDLIALAKAKPGELNYSMGSTGGPTYMGMELFKSMAGVNLVRVPYKGTGPGMQALLNGEVQLTITDVNTVVPLMKTSRLRALAVTSAEPSALAPGLPTVSASGLPGFEAVGITGMFAPGKTPGAIINRLYQEVVRVFNRADVKEKFLMPASSLSAVRPSSSRS